MIIECIFSTLNSAGEPNFAPMGILWGNQEVIVRPFRQTNTYRNLLASGYGVASMTDNVRAYVRTSLYKETLPHFPARAIPGVVYQDACFWIELQVATVGGDEKRADIRCSVVEKGRTRDFLGFCRARNAIIEAAILATRLNMYKPEWIWENLSKYEEIVEKTGDEAENIAFQDIRTYVRRWMNNDHD